MSRRIRSREVLVQMFYQMTMLGDFSEDVKEQFLEERTEGEPNLDEAYMTKVLNLFREHQTEIDGLIGAGSKNWKFTRISKIDLAILRVAVTEVLFLRRDIPQAASINAAVELAKVYGGEKSPKFVNGILGWVVNGR
ncbi:MAG: transcription antitermination factor NusB [Clostridiales Family XIII bacterium]|jgi:N utilization substance protein B|nr:transcription antitermination factor NusB [Clostridiales Family XIII bacterium]